MIRVILCDDDSVSVNKYALLVREMSDRNQIDCKVSTYLSGESLLLDVIETPEIADIIYLDILMGNINGLNAAKKLREYGCMAEIIFLTNSEDYVYDAFDISPVQYLLKDSVTADKFDSVFLKAVNLVTQKKQEIFLFEAGGVTKVIPIREISFFEIRKRIVTVHYGGKSSFDFYQTLEQLQEQLGNNHFIRIHRSFIIHLPYVAKFERQNMILKTGESLPIGVTYSQYVKIAFSEYAINMSNFKM